MKTFQELVESAPHIIKRKLEQLKFLRERPDYHPEASAFHHIQIVTERLIQTGDINLVLTGILHDICKFDTVKMNEKNGWPTSPGHEDASCELIMKNADVQSWIYDNSGDYIKVAELCRHHMRFHQLGEMRNIKKDKWIKVWSEMGIWDQLQIFGAADNMIEDFDLNNLEKSWKWKRNN
jgi:hypothetical protein